MKKIVLLLLLLFISYPANAHDTFKGYVIDVYDADTLTVSFRLPFNIQYTDKIRLNGLNSPEIRTLDKKEKALAIEARDFVRDLILNKEVDIKIVKREKFGRYLAEVYLYDGTFLNALLIEKKYAREYHGERRGKWEMK